MDKRYSRIASQISEFLVSPPLFPFCTIPLLLCLVKQLRGLHLGPQLLRRWFGATLGLNRRVRGWRGGRRRRAGLEGGHERRGEVPEGKPHEEAGQEGKPHEEAGQEGRPHEEAGQEEDPKGADHRDDLHTLAPKGQTAVREENHTKRRWS
ncbi:hypothetical protein B0H10DRAFT_1021590 [Mycena sp. CBHHK59/15]|nr:hypothetical protein B0H10DRAFT_1021590 [Mycena sp. CBHHK59/15]